MIISYQWLKEFVDIDESPKELAEKLTMAGLEVDAVHSLEKGLDRVVVGRILSRDPVSDSDHLTLCQVDVGDEKLQIVCGAPNHRKGDHVLVALPGAELPEGLKIGKTKLRGIESHGMICSEKELGISDEAAGVMILSQDSEVGAQASEVLGRNDTILEIDLTPNRADALSHLGVARDVAALSGRTLKKPEIVLQETGSDIVSLSTVEVQDPELCLRYLGRVITDATVRPSPPWMQQRLRAVGLRPINNVVDVTNYVLMEWGHPLHAFDYDLLTGHRIIVRRAAENEKIKTLDGVERSVDPSVLLICDADKPVAIAGIMGGSNTEVNESTKRIFLEAACFHPTSIRKTSKKLGLHSESSHRFERGTDIAEMVAALDRAASLIQELTGGTLAKGRIDIYPSISLPVEIMVRSDRVRSVLGIHISDEEMMNILRSLSLEIVREDQGTVVVRVPSFRLDLTREIDIIEEIARVYGYDQITSTLPKAVIVSEKMSLQQRVTVMAREALSGLGYHEVIHYSFHNPEDMDALCIPMEDTLRSQVRIRNPLSEDQSVLRTTLIPGMIHTMRRNLKRSLSDIRVFEIGRVYESRKSGLPLEKNRLAGLVNGKDRPAGWDALPRDLDFYDLKGNLEIFFECIGVCDVRFVSDELPCFLHPGKSAWVESSGTRLGFVGEIHPSVIKRFDVSERIQCFELDLDLCVQQVREEINYVPLPRFPSVERDIALILADEIPAGDVEEQIRISDPELIREVRLFDLYSGKPIPSGKKSLAFSIRFQSSDRTLRDEEINSIRDRIVDGLNEKFKAVLRDT